MAKEKAECPLGPIQTTPTPAKVGGCTLIIPEVEAQRNAEVLWPERRGVSNRTVVEVAER
jgi:hypothetical protein